MDQAGLTGIIPFTLYSGEQDRSAGSSILRADNIAKNSPGFEIWQHGKKYDNLIFQKAYWKEMMKTFWGPKILDLSDPDWIPGHVNIVEVGGLVDAISCSSETLTKVVQNFFPKKLVVHVPDRFDFNTFPSFRERHVGIAKKVVWFGYIHNAHETLSKMIPIIKKNDLTLKIISDYQYEKKDLEGINVEYLKYAPDTAYLAIRDADIVLNPKSERAYYKFKSNNKNVIGWKLGLPVAETPEEFERFLSPENRNLEIREKTKLLDDYRIEKSIQQYVEIINQVKEDNYSHKVHLPVYGHLV
jgi:hypothetical protein